MKQISFEEFERRFMPIHYYLERRSIIDDAIKTIFGMTTSEYADEADKLCDAYSDLLASFLDIEDVDLFGWFIYTNDLGANELAPKGTTEKIRNLSDFYSYLVKYA